MKLDTSLFEPSNLHAWCIVPFDRGKRNSRERMGMLNELGLSRLAYDWREEHIPTFDEEFLQAREHGVVINAWFFPWGWDEAARASVEAMLRHGATPQLWVNGGGGPVSSASEQEERVRVELERVRPFVKFGAENGMVIALYNHGGWYGEPENQLELVRQFSEEGFSNVGLVYNQHHGHHHVPRFPELMEMMKPHLLAFNLNGMDAEGDQRGRKILPIGYGELDVELLGIVAKSGWRGPVGILNHTEEDSRERLLDNLEGLEWVVRRLEGEDVAERPGARSWSSEV